VNKTLLLTTGPAHNNSAYKQATPLRRQDKPSHERLEQAKQCLGTLDLAGYCLAAEGSEGTRRPFASTGKVEERRAYGSGNIL
jgi:hypothetical protein